ncbi:putative protein phosphatase 2C 12 [Wolffia australiana]
MGSCYSSASGGEREGEENVRYVVEEDGRTTPKQARKMASLYSLRGKKGPNQDSAIFHQGYGPEGGVFCGVFDGHGRNGHRVSETVRDRLPSLVLSRRSSLTVEDDASEESESSSSDESSVSSPESFDEWKEACVSAFKAMDRELASDAALGCRCSGAAAVTAIKQGKDLIIANLGDSRAILASSSEQGDGPLVCPLTTDLKPSLPQEAERIKRRNGVIYSVSEDPETARVWAPEDDSPGLAMARAFGDLQLKRYGVISVPQVSYRRLTPRDQFVVLATDGVWDVLSNEEVAEMVWAGKREEAAKTVAEAAARAWRVKFPAARADDCSVVCLFLHEPDEPVDLRRS